MQPGTSAPPNTPEALLGPSRPLLGILEKARLHSRFRRRKRGMG